MTDIITTFLSLLILFYFAVIFHLNQLAQDLAFWSKKN